MAYNLYQVQMAKAWSERIEKENAQAEKFWTEQAMKTTGNLPPTTGTLPAPGGYAGSVAGSRVSSAAPTGYTSKSAFLKDRLEKLENELQHEREYRLKVEEELSVLRTSSPRPGTSSKPGTPKHSQR